MLKRITTAVLAAALTFVLSPATASPVPAATAGDSHEQLQHPLALDRGPAPRVLSMVGSQIRFPSGRTVTFRPPQGVTGHARLIGRFRSNAVVWAPVGPRESAVFKVRPSGVVTRLGRPVLDLYRENDYVIAGGVLYVGASDARSRTRLSRASLVDGRVLRRWISARGQLWTLLDATPTRAAIGTTRRLRTWKADGTFEKVYTDPSNRYSDPSFASLRHDWFAVRTGNGTELRRLSAPGRVVWKKGFENEMLPFDISGDGSVLLTTEYETYSPQMRDPSTGRILRSYYGGYRNAYNDNEQLVLEGSRAFLVVMNLRVDGQHRELLVRCTMGGRCERASRVASSISLVTHGS